MKSRIRRLEPEMLDNMQRLNLYCATLLVALLWSAAGAATA